MITIEDDLVPQTTTYEDFLDTLSMCDLQSIFHVSHHEYTINASVYEKAVEEGYIRFEIDAYTPTCYRGIVTRVPNKTSLSEELINKYYS